MIAVLAVASCADRAQDEGPPAPPREPENPAEVAASTAEPEGTDASAVSPPPEPAPSAVIEHDVERQHVRATLARSSGGANPAMATTTRHDVGDRISTRSTSRSESW